MNTICQSKGDSSKSSFLCAIFVYLVQIPLVIWYASGMIPIHPIIIMLPLIGLLNLMKKVKFFHLIIILSLMMCFSGCKSFNTETNAIRGSGELTSSSQKTNMFNRISIGIPSNVFILQGDENSLVIEGDENIISLIKADSRDSTLFIHYETDLTNIHPVHPVKLTLTTKSLIGISNSDCARINLSRIETDYLTLDTYCGDINASNIKANNLEINLSGSGNLNFQSVLTDQLSIILSGVGNIEIDSLTADTLDAQMSGYGNVILTGGTIEQHDVISGSGGYHADNLCSKRVNILISGSANATIRVIDELIARIPGSGMLNFIGDPRLDIFGADFKNVKRIDVQ